MMPRISVLVVDDHAVVRSGLVGLLRAAGDIDVVGEAADGEEAVAFIASAIEGTPADGPSDDGARLPDVVLTDLRMPRLDGVGATKQILQLAPGTRVLVLTTYDTDGDILRAVEAGACGYLLKDATRDELTEAVRAAARGETVLAPPIASRLVRRMQDPRARLTEREIEVLREVALGHSNAEIGAQLFIAEATVKTHLLRIYGKLDVDDRTRAVVVAMERGEL